MKTIAFVTSSEDPGLTGDDRLAIEPLRQRDISVHALVWDRSAPEETRRFDALIFRSCWNYHRKAAQFLHWMHALEALEVQAFNPINISVWNIDKKYLLELEQRGVPIPATRLVPAATGSTGPLSDLNGDQFVVKPRVPLNGENTRLVRRAELDIALHEAWMKGLGELIVQEYQPGIRNGEISLVFFAGQFSHAIRKVPAPGEFRVQQEHGGKRVPFEPSFTRVQQAQAILSRPNPSRCSSPGWTWSKARAAPS